MGCSDRDCIPVWVMTFAIIVLVFYGIKLIDTLYPEANKKATVIERTTKPVE